MTEDYEKLANLSSMTGKPVIVIYNKAEGNKYVFLVDEFKPSNPSNHIHDNYLFGKDVKSLLTSMSGYTHGYNVSDQGTINTKLETIPSIKFYFDDICSWVKIIN